MAKEQWTALGLLAVIVLAYVLVGRRARGSRRFAAGYFWMLGIIGIAMGLLLGGASDYLLPLVLLQLGAAYLAFSRR